MCLCSGEDGAMGWRRWQAWVGVIAVALGMAVAGSAHGAGPEEKVPVAASKEVEEAKRLAIDVQRLIVQGNYDDAFPLAQRALVIREKALGPDHPDVATSLNNLALLYQTKGDYARAEPLYQRALVIREKALGPDHAYVATSLNNLAALYRTKGDYTHAEPLYQRALAIREKALGPDHAYVATSLNGLAALYRSKGDDTRAELFDQHAQAIWEKALGLDRPHVAPPLDNLPAVYGAMGDDASTKPLYQHAVAIPEKALGPDHGDVALDNLPAVYGAMRDDASTKPLYRAKAKEDDVSAEPLHQRALATVEEALGPDHPDVAISLNSLAKLYVAQGRLTQGVNAARRAADIQDHNAATLLATGHRFRGAEAPLHEHTCRRYALGHLSARSARANQPGRRAPCAHGPAPA